MKKSILFLALIIILRFTGNAQSIAPAVFSTAGDHFTNTNSQLSWTLGETVTETVQNTQSMITQGFHQPSYLITKMEEEGNGNLQMEVFPNPFSDILQIKCLSGAGEDILFRLYDISGKELPLPGIHKNKEIWEMNTSVLPAGVYLLKSIRNREESIYKIQKNY